MRRRPISPFSLSFLDIMFCGFGAVVLLVLILNTDTVRARNETFADLRGQVVRLEQEVIIGEEQRVQARTAQLTAANRDLQAEIEQRKRQKQRAKAIDAILELRHKTKPVAAGAVRAARVKGRP